MTLEIRPLHSKIAIFIDKAAGEAVGHPKRVYEEDVDGERVASWKATGDEGLVGYLKWISIHYPSTYCSMLAKIIPMQVRVDTQQVIKGSVGDLEAIRAEIKRRGLKLDRFLESSKLIDAKPVEVAEPVPVASGDTREDG